MKAWQRWAVVILFAAAMAWVESAVVLDLRTLVSRLQPYQANPLPQSANLGTAEVVREAATLVMLATVGWLAALGAAAWVTPWWRLAFGTFYTTSG